ncbi:MAG: SUMF1/EgtB/PvdO family nonheme iron enzyme [Myxococcales bacterium]|nr:SUMF1/EgtB/PvdO family nonheme iron enzyme [Myxococcales bacterium]
MAHERIRSKLASVLSRFSTFGLLLGVLASCSSSSTNPASAACEPGELKQCSCPDGGTGTAPCQSGQFGACSCGDAGVGGGAGAAGTGGLGGAAGVGGSGGSGGQKEPPSCKGLSPCPTGDSCCKSPLLPAGSFSRDALLEAKYKAKVSAFRLDAFEVTVGRFRNFVSAVVAGWKPQAGSGKHQPTALKDEPGWQAELYIDLWPSLDGWNTNVPKCQGGSASWSPAAGTNDNLPMNCVSFPQAYAFCIWDGGYLPTEAELSYAWVGADAPRPFPWGGAPVTTKLATVGFPAQGLPPPVASTPSGASPAGHFDLLGSLFEYALDHFNGAGEYPVSPCDDNCVRLSSNPKADRAIRGGGWVNLASEIHAGSRLPWFVGGHNTGFRCARPPS